MGYAVAEQEGEANRCPSTRDKVAKIFTRSVPEDDDGQSLGIMQLMPA